MKVAIVSTGLGRVLRGFESFSESLFQALREFARDVDVTLFQGGGAAEAGRIVVPNLHRHDFPARCFSDLTASHIEKRSFALALYPRLVMGAYDVVHYNELTLGSALFHLRRSLGGKFKLLYCNGAPSPAIHYHHRCDFAQLLTDSQHEEAVAFGVPEERIFPVPYGLDARRFSPETATSRQAIREELGIPQAANVILSVAAIKREHKRIDYLINEVAGLEGSDWLVVAGQRTQDTAELEKLAEDRLPGRWRFVSWPHEKLSRLYGAADVFALCSLSEAFGLVTIEAMLSGVPVVIHHGPVFQSLAVGTAACLVDMGGGGALTGALNGILSKGGRTGLELDVRRSREAAQRRFSWEALVPHYRNMYHKVTSS